MYSDIIPPKKNTFINKRNNNQELHILKDKKISTKNLDVRSNHIYHTIDGKDKRSKIPLILFLCTILVLSIVYYSIFNNKTYISFETKTVIFEVKDNISMILSEKNTNSSTTLSYNLIYNNADNKDRNIFAPITNISSTSKSISTTTNVNTKELKEKEYYTLNSATTSSDIFKKIILINETNNNIQLVKNTRFEIEGKTFYLSEDVNVKKIDKNLISTSTLNKYKVIGFKGTKNYDKFYAIDYVNDLSKSTTTEIVKQDNSNVPSDDILSLIPENLIPLKKNYVYDNSINQSALIVIDKKDFEKVLINNSRLIQDYVTIFKPVYDLIEYEININDYELSLDPITGLPIAFKNLNIEIIPHIKKDQVASVFKGFSKETMKKIKTDIQRNINMQVKYSPFWVSKVSDEDNIIVEVK